MRQSDLAHVHRALKTLGKVREDYPELFDDEDDFHYVVAWEIVNTLLLEQYKETE